MPESGQHPLDLSGGDSVLSPSGHPLLPSVVSTTNSTSRSNSVICGSSSVSSITTTTTSGAQQQLSLASKLTVPSREHISEHISNLILNNTAIIESVSPHPSSLLHHHSSRRSTSSAQHSSNTNTTSRSSSSSSSSVHYGGSRYSVPSSTVSLNSTLPVSISGQYRRYSTEVPSHGLSTPNYSKLQSALLGEPSIVESSSAGSSNQSNLNHNQNSHSTSQHKAQHVRKYSEISVPSQYSSFQPPHSSQLTQPLYHQIPNQPSLDQFKFPVHPNNNASHYGFHSSIAVAAASASGITVPSSQYPAQLLIPAYNSQHLQHLQHHPNQLSVIINARDQHQHNLQLSGHDSGLSSGHQSESLRFSPIGDSSRSSSEPSLVRNLLTSKTSPFAQLKSDQQHGSHSSPHGSSTSAGSSSQFVSKSSNGSIIKNLLLSKSRTNTNSTTTTSSQQNPQVQEDLSIHYPSTAASTTTRPNEPARKRSRGLDNNNNNNSSSSSLSTDPTNSGSVFSCNLCHVVFRNRQNFEVHQRIYCRGKPSTSSSSSSNDQLPSAIRKRSYHHYFDSESSISSVGATSGLVPPLPPAPSIIKEETDSGSVVRRTSSSIRKVSVQERPTIITYHVPGYRDHRGLSLDSIDSQDTGHSESTESQYSATTQRLSRTSLDTEPSSAISPNQPNTATSTTLSTAGSNLQPSSNDASPFGHILKSKLLGSSGSNNLLNKRRKTSEPAFSYNYELKRHARESFAKQPSHHRHVSTLTKPGLKLGHPSQQQQQSLEILPAYMPYLIRAPIKITIKGPVQFPILNELIEAGTNHEFRAVSPDELDESLEMDDQDGQEDEEPLCWNQIPQKFDTNQVKVELDDEPKSFNGDSLLVSADQQEPVALQEKVDQSVKETVTHLLDLVVVDQKEPLFGECPSPSLEVCQDVVDCLNQLLNSVVNSSTMTIDKVSEVRKTDTTITTTTSTSNDDHDFKKSNLSKKSCQLERPTTLNFATYDQSARNQNEFGTSRFIDRLNQRFLTANRNQPQSFPPKLSIFVNRCSDQDQDNQDHRRHSKQSLIASTLVSPDTPRSKRKYQQLSINGNAFTNLDLKVAIRTTFCCLYRAQPMFVTQEANPQLSMYSQWKTLPIPAGDILEHLPSPHSLLGAYNSQEAVYLAARCSSGSSTQISTSTSSTTTTAAATVNHVGGPYIRMKESVATTCCSTTAAQCLVNQNPGESIKVEQSHYDDEPQSGTVNCQFSDQVSTQISTIHSETTTTCATSPTTITSNSNSKINHQLYDQTLSAFVIPLGSGHSDRLKDSLTSSQFVLVHSSQHYQSSLYYKKRSRSHNLIINDYYHHHHHRHHQATNAPQAGDMVIAAGCSLSSMTTTTAGGVTTSSSGDLTTSAVDPNVVTSLPIVQNRSRKRSSTVSTNGLPGSGLNGDLSMYPMLDHLPLQSRQVVMYIMMMSQCSPALSIPTVSEMASSMNFAARKFSECIGLRHPNHQQYEENWATRLGPDATAEELIPKRIKIFEGGFKSNEDYTYVRGRGRGKYVCEECGIRCKKPSMLKKHIRTHTDLRPYSCRHCAFAFKTKGNLTKHMKSKAHYKKCVDMGIDPVPIAIDESQIDSDALAKQEQYELSCGSSGAFNQFADDDDDCDEDYEDEDCDDEDEEDDEGVPIPLIEQQRLTYVVPGQFDDADNRHQHLLHQQRPLHDTVRKLSTSASRKNSTNSNYNSAKNGSNSSISSGYSSTTSIFNDLQQQFGSENVGAILSTTTSGLPLSQSSLSSTSTLSQIGDSIQSHVVRQCLPGNQQPADKIATASHHHHPSQFVDDHQTSNQRDFRETTLQDANTRRLSANMAPSANCNSATAKVSTTATTAAAAATSSMSISGDRQHLPYRQLQSNQPNPIIIKSSDTADLVSNYRLNESRRLSDDASASMIAILNNDTAIGGNDNDSGDEDSVDNQWRRNNNNNNNGRCRMGPLLQSPANTTPVIGNIATNGNNVPTTTTTSNSTTNEPEAEAARSLLILSGFGQQSSSSSQSQPSLNEPAVSRKLSFINNNNNNLIEPLSEKIILNGIVVGERRRRQPQVSLPGPPIPTSSTSSVYNFTDTSEMPMVLEQVLAPGHSQPKSSNSSSSLLPAVASNQTSVIIARRSSPINHQPYLVDHSMSLSSKKAPPNLPQPFVPRDSSSPIQTQQQHQSKLSTQQKQQSMPNSLFSISSLIGPSVAVSTSTSANTIPYSRYTPPAPTTAGIAINSGLGSHPYAAIIADDIQRHASISQELLLQARGQHHQLRQSQQQQDLRIHYPHHQQQQQQSGPYMGLFDGNSNVSQLAQPIQFANSTLSSQSSNSTNSVSRTQNRRNGSSPKSFETSVTKETSLSTKGSSSLVFQNSSIKNVCEPSAVIATGYQAGNKSFQSSSSSPSTVVHQHFSSPSTNVPLPPPPSSPLPAPTITVATDKRPPSSSSSSSLNNNKDDSEQPIDLSAKASSIVEPHKDSAPKTLIHSPLSTFSLSPDGKVLHHQQPQQKYRQSVESKQHLTEQITRAFSPLSEMQTLPIMDFPPNHHHHQQRLPNHSKNKGRELYNSLRSEDFVHLTPGVHTPHRLPQNVVSLSNSRDNHHPGQSQSSQAGITSATITTGSSTSSSSPSSRSSLAMQKNSVILSSYTTSEGKSVCTICMKQFSKLSQLRLHVNIHFFERPYRCDSCAVSFRTKGHLQKHSRSVSHLNKLNMNITFGRASSDNPRPFKCSDCKIAFRIHGHLAKHLRSKIHIMKLECLGKLPFGMFAEMERSSSNLNLIDTTNCEKALETLRSLAQKLYDPRQMCWKIPETMEADGMDDDDDDSNLMMDGDELIDGDEMIDGEESFSTSSTNTTTTGPSLQDQMISSPQDTNNNQQVVVNFNQSAGPDSKQQPTPPLAVVPNQPESTTTPTQAASTFSSPSVVINNSNNSTSHSSLGGILASTRSNTCHLCGRLFKGAKFLQVHLYCDHPEADQATSSPSNATTTTAAAATI